MNDMASVNKNRKLLVLDTSYTLEMIKEMQLDEAVLYRDLNGYFDHVWSVHPYSTVIPPKNQNEIYGGITITNFAKRHTIIEGKVGRLKFLKKLSVINFFISQASLLSYLHKLIKKERINVIRTGDPYYLALLGLFLSWTHSIPFVIRMPSNYDKYYQETGRPAMPRLFRKRWIEKIIERFVLKRADLVAGANEDNRNFAVINGARREYTTVFRYGNLIHPAHRVSPDKRPFADLLLKELGLSDTPFVISIARLEAIKRQDHVLKAVAEINKRGKKLKAVLVGDGSMKSFLIELAKDMYIGDEIIFVGNKDQEWIATILPHAAAVLSPHSGRALSEAALAGVPIVAYDFEWQSELIKTGETGELVENNDVHGMVDAVMRYLDNPDYAKRMGENVRAKALEMMNPEKLYEHEKNEYEKLFVRYYKQKGDGETI